MNNMNNSNEKSILYYPSIRIEDGIWLRNAILYWDKVGSIVPGYNYSEFNSPEIEYLKDNDIYEPVFPYLLTEDEEIYKNFINEVKLKLNNIRKNSRDSNKNYTKIHLDKIAMKNNTMLHLNKIPNDLLDFLIDEGIVFKNNDGPWLDIKSREAEVYMSIQAKYLAKIKGNTDIGTDNRDKFFKPYRRKHTYCDNPDLYLDIALQDILPEPIIDNNSIQDIIEFRCKHKSELITFRQKLENYYDKLKIYDDEFYDMYNKTQKFKHEIEEELCELENIYKKEKIKTIRSSLRALIYVACDTSIAYATLKNLISDENAIIASFCVSITPLFFNKDKFVKTDTINSNMYLFNAKKEGLIK